VSNDSKTPTPPHYKAIQRDALTKDLLYFTEHPDKDVYWRRIIAGEMWPDVDYPPTYWVKVTRRDGDVPIREVFENAPH
jgi:hypothetical protein